MTKDAAQRSIRTFYETIKHGNQDNDAKPDCAHFMHIPDGFLNNTLNLSLAGLSGITMILAVKKAGRNLTEKEVPLVGVTAAFIFAAQMINFPVAGGTSGHFLGAVLASLLLGPWLSFNAMALVLVLQCLGFADGGLTALGSNIFNMGLVGGMGGYLIFQTCRFIFPSSKRGFLLAGAIAAWFSVVLAALSCAVELGLSGISPFVLVIPSMVGFHALIGIGEAVITSTILSAVLAARPDLIRAWKIYSETDRHHPDA
jgi:cobalt/nickel transport system permease protein